jgi:lipoate-protein ligase A
MVGMLCLKCTLTCFLRVPSTRKTKKKKKKTIALESIPRIQKYYDAIQDWDWRFGRSPDFTHTLENRFDSFASMTVHIDSHDGVISDVKVFSDGLYPEFVESMEMHLKGVRYGPAEVVEAMEKVRLDMEVADCAAGEHAREVGEWLASAV